MHALGTGTDDDADDAGHRHRGTQVNFSVLIPSDVPAVWKFSLVCARARAPQQRKKYGAPEWTLGTSGTPENEDIVS